MTTGGGDLGRAVFELSTDDSKLKSGFSGAEKKAKGLGIGIESALKVGALAGGAAVVAGLGAAVGAAMDFEQSLADTASATGATKEQMAAMRTEALGIGKDTSKGASDAALAMGELVKAGMPVETVVNGAARAAVQLSEATGIDVPNAAILMSKAMTTFKADGLNAEQTANLLAKAANASAIGVTDIGMSLAAVGPVASMAGLSTEDFATAVGILGNNALVGADAGTSLKTMLTSLMAPSDAAKGALRDIGVSVYDAQGQMKPFRTLIGELGPALMSMGEEQRNAAAKTIFGSDAIRAANILLGEGVAGWDAFGESMAKAPTLAEQSAIKMATLKGQIEMLMGSIETIAIIIGSALLPVLTKLVKGIADVLTVVMDGVPKVIDWFKKFVSAGSDSSSALGKHFQVILDAFQPVIDTLKDFAEVILPEVQAVIEVWAPVIMGIFEDLATFFRAHADEIEQIFTAVWDVIGGVVKAGVEIIKGIILVFLDVLQGDWDGAWTHIKEMVIGVNEGINQAVQGLLNILLGIVELALSSLAGLAAAAWDGLKQTAAAAWAGLVAAIQAEAQNAVSVVSALPGQLVGAIGDLGSLLWQAGANLIQGLINGITSKIGELRNTLSGVTNLIPDWKGPLTEDRNLLRPAGSAIMGGLMAGMASQERRLKDYLGDWNTYIPQAAVSAVMSGGAVGGAAASGGGFGIDYDALAAAIARTPPRVELDGRRVSEGLRPHLYGIRQRAGSVFGES